MRKTVNWTVCWKLVYALIPNHYPYKTRKCSFRVTYFSCPDTSTSVLLYVFHSFLLDAPTNYGSSLLFLTIVGSKTDFLLLKCFLPKAQSALIGQLASSILIDQEMSRQSSFLVSRGYLRRRNTSTAELASVLQQEIAPAKKRKTQHHMVLPSAKLLAVVAFAKLQLDPVACQNLCKVCGKPRVTQ